MSERGVSRPGINMRVGVVGCGYLGTTTAVCLASMGHRVLATDVDTARLEALSRGEAPFYEPGLADLLNQTLSSGRLKFTDNVEHVVHGSDVIFLCVGTPQSAGELGTDMRQVDSAARAVFAAIDHPVVVVGKSTVPVGTAVRLRSQLKAHSPDSELVWSPEFLREGHAINDTIQPDRIVIGAHTADTRGPQAVTDVFASQVDSGVPVVHTDLPTAELVKISANAFLATKISFVNAMAEVCDAAGADVLRLAEALGYDDRIGAKFLRPGLGYGGGCLPKDVRALFARGGELGVAQAVAFLDEVDAINQRCRSRVVALAEEVLGGSVAGRRIGVLGAAFKPDTDDTRDSPALDVAGRLHLRGADVTVYDPQAMPNARRQRPTLGYADSAVGACEGVDLVLLLTEWPEFLELHPADLAQIVGHPRVIDARHALRRRQWSEAGWDYRAPGTPVT